MAAGMETECGIVFVCIVHLSLESDWLMYVSNYSLQNIAISALNCAYSLLGLECVLATHICLFF